MFAFGNRTGCRSIIVDAYTEATEFYLKYGLNLISKKNTEKLDRCIMI